MKASPLLDGVSLQPSDVNGARRALAREDAKELVDASRKLEGVFLNMVFEEMAKTVPKDTLFKDAPGMDMVQSWLRTELSQRWAESGGAGIGNAIARQVGGEGVDFVLAGQSPNRSFAPPVDGVVTSGFGFRVHPTTHQNDLHEGVDIAVPTGTDVRSPFPGTVTRVDEHPRLGHMVVLTHPAGYQTVYGHLESPTVAEGERVSAGSVIARSGESGTATGPHLHFSMFLNGRSVDPSQWIPALKSTENTEP